MTQPAESEYDAIAGAYKDSKQLSFRKYIEEYTLFEMLGDISGVKALDLACGEGFYTRKLKQAGAGEVLGVDVSAEMIRLAEAEERARPTGCRYLNRDAAALVLDEPVDLVVALYLLNYARDADELLRFVRAAHGALKPGGRFVGFNDNVLNAPGGTVSYARYGFEKVYTRRAEAPNEGDPIVYRFTNDDGTRFEFNNYYLSPGTYCRVFEEAGFTGFRWVDPQLHPSERNNKFWDEFMAAPPIIGFEAVRE
ncbi:MAG: class I SAM-dependent methyltransferase [Gemmatimonadetes bacterium]|nr:class I SAM-dependent methyltransferase [Gemmatimonadota bacterium]MYD26983.1 class I SAM-dependent methyltransferase [Gemmatimonadota bacterium]MYI98791.1 class I SAM-dependent methyltransferase [Gemmatimonadota bacterium]